MRERAKGNMERKDMMHNARYNGKNRNHRNLKDKVNVVKTVDVHGNEREILSFDASGYTNHTFESNEEMKQHDRKMQQMRKNGEIGLYNPKRNDMQIRMMRKARGINVHGQKGSVFTHNGQGVMKEKISFKDRAKKGAEKRARSQKLAMRQKAELAKAKEQGPKAEVRFYGKAKGSRKRLDLLNL